MLTSIAIIGADGAGKSTVCREVLERLPFPVKYVYMGVNLEASKLMLPTTRLVLALKQRRGLRPDSSMPDPARTAATPKSPAKRIKAFLRMIYWVSEEWFRQLAIWQYQIRGNTVVFDRHFYADYYAYDIAPTDSTRPLPNRIHGFLLDKIYPKPNLFIMLDAPPEVLFARKGEGTLEWLEDRRQQYLALRDHVERFEIVDATQPQSCVVEAVEALIRDFVAARSRRT